MECFAEQEDADPEEEDEQYDVPENLILCEDGDGVEPQIGVPQMTIEFVRKMFRSLNEMQASIFYPPVVPEACVWS